MRPDFGPEYQVWLSDKFGMTNFDAQARLYDYAASEIISHFSKSKFWQQISNNMKELDTFYLIKKQTSLDRGL